jgi:hypothetical protein
MKPVQTVRPFQIKYPRDTPRISRKRDWIDRSEWRKDPQSTLEGGKAMIDVGMEKARTQGTMEDQNYNDLPDLAQRSAQIGIRRF